MVFCCKTVDYSCWAQLLHQVKELIILGLVNESKVEYEMDRQFGATSALMQMEFRIVLVKKEPSQSVNLFTIN